jgi:hypothetical protein
MNVFKRASMFEDIQTNAIKEKFFYQKFTFYKIVLAFGFYMQNQINMGTNMPPLEQVPKLQGPNPDAQKYQEDLIELIKSIQGWEKMTEKEQRVPVKKFMSALGHLFLDYFQFHLDEANACALQYRSLLNYSVDPITSYIINLWHSLSGAGEYDDPWETACWGRTNIEAFNTMFKQALDLPLDPEGIDVYMKDRKGTVSLPWELIPKNAPHSHWWWFEDFGRSRLINDKSIGMSYSHNDV